MTVAAELAVALHHSRGVGPAVPHEALRGQTPASSVGRRPGVFEEPVPPVVVDRVQRHFMEDLGTVCPFVQILDLPVPQMVDNVLDALRRLDLPIAEQVIDVPKISCSPCPSRCPIPEPQSAEQLVEVPTVLSPTRIALRIAEQIVDTPVLRGRGQGCVHGFLQEQSTTATPSAEERISERIVEQFSPSSVKRTSERIEEQIVFLLQVVAWDTGLPHLLVLQMRILLGVFRTFPRGKKVRVLPRVRVRSCPGRSAHGLRRLMARPSVPTSGCSSPRRANPSTGTDAPTRPPHLRASRLSGSASSLLQGGLVLAQGNACQYL